MQVVQVPARFTRTLALALTRTADGVYGATVDPERLHTPPTGPTYYVDPVNGSNTNTGLSWAQAFKTPQYATAKNSRDYGTVVVKGGVYQRVDLPTLLGAGPKTIRAAVDAFGIRERVVFVCGDRLTTWTALGGGVYSAPIATSNGVLDALTRDEHGLGRALTTAASAAAVATTPGSYHFAAGTVTVRLADDRAPDADVYVLRTVNSVALTAAAPTSIYLDGLEWWGGTTANLTASVDGVRLYAKRCGWHLARSTNGLTVNALSTVVLEDCAAHRNWLDGFNYHDVAGRSGEVVEVRCTALDNGMTPGSQNGSTAHDTYRIVRSGGLYARNRGANVADVNLARSFNYGVAAAGSTEYGIDFFGDDMTLLSCSSTSPTAAQVATPGVGEVRVRGLTRTGVTIGTTPLVDVDIYAPEAQLLVAGVPVDDLDLVPGFREVATSGNVVQVPAGDPAAVAVTVRPTRQLHGRLVAHLTRTTHRGAPGVRAEALLASLRSGSPHTLRFLDPEPGVAGDYLLVPVGDAERHKAPRERAWTVEADFTRTAAT